MVKKKNSTVDEDNEKTKDIASDTTQTEKTDETAVDEASAKQTAKDDKTATEDDAVEPKGAETECAEENKDEEKDPVKILEEKVEKAETASKEAYDRLLRATAEYDNYKKRSSRELSEFKKFANESLIKELLPVIDNLERAMDSALQDDTANKGVVDGVQMILNEFYKVLEKFNLKPLDSKGKTFDPNFHQAVMQEESVEVPENTVIKVMQKGYVLHDRLIRPAMVVVSKGGPKKEVKSDAANEAKDDAVNKNEADKESADQA